MNEWSVLRTKDRFSNPIVVVESNDFTHDVWLEVSGDFETIEKKESYAQTIADKLNGQKDK